VALTTIAGLFGERYGGNPPAVLALHGWGRDHADFASTLHDIPAIAIDLPGFGASPAPASGMGSAEYATAVAPVLNEFSAPPILVGHSFGGRVAVHLAATHQVSGLVLIGVPLLRGRPTRKPPLGYRVRRSLAFLLGSEQLERARRRHGSVDYRAASGVMRDTLVAAVNESYEDLLPAITCRTELIWGSEDQEVPLRVARAALELMPNAHLSVIPQAGHHVLLSAPEFVREHILEML